MDSKALFIGREITAARNLIVTGINRKAYLGSVPSRVSQTLETRYC